LEEHDQCFTQRSIHRHNAINASKEKERKAKDTVKQLRQLRKVLKNCISESIQQTGISPDDVVDDVSPSLGSIKERVL
jgi:hypothetical protein